MQWLSRTLAVLIFMVGPGWLGSLIDARLKTAYFMPAGFVLGIALAMTALIVLAQKLTPPAGGMPLPLDKEELENQQTEETLRSHPEPPDRRDARGNQRL
jgi:hypothetical protein